MGTERCKKEFKTYGLTTLIKKHIKIDSNSKMLIQFIGKKTKNRCLIKDPDVIKTIKEITTNLKNNQNRLFTYNSDKGIKELTGTDVNTYLKKYDKSITSKEFRTWAANKLFISELLKTKTIPKEEKDRKKRLKDVDKVCAKK